MKTDDPSQRLAAVRALAEWSDAAPLDELVALATTTDDAKCKVFALRGVAKLAPLAKDRPPADVVKLISRAMATGGGVGERRALLGALGNFHGAQALKAAEACLKDPDLAAEAKAAIQQIKAGGKAKSARSGGPAFSEDIVKLFDTLDNLARAAARRRISTACRRTARASRRSRRLTAIRPVTGMRLTSRSSITCGSSSGNARTVSTLRILGFGHHNYAPKDFEVICDGKVVKKVEGAEYKDNLLTLALPPTECSVVELKITGYYGRSPAIRELGIYGSAVKTK